MWAKVKCFFGFCAEENEIKIKEKLAVDRTYKVQPIVRTVETPKVKTPKAVKTVKKSKTVKKVKDIEVEIKLEELKELKVKRHWFNNSKTQKLVAEGADTEALPKTWKKGKLPKKGDK